MRLVVRSRVAQRASATVESGQPDAGDLEGSTRLWEQYPQAMKKASARHDEILRDAIADYLGHIVKMAGDGVPALLPFGDAGVPA